MSQQDLQTTLEMEHPDVRGVTECLAHIYFTRYEKAKLCLDDPVCWWLAAQNRIKIASQQSYHFHKAENLSAEIRRRAVGISQRNNSSDQLANWHEAQYNIAANITDRLYGDGCLTPLND